MNLPGYDAWKLASPHDLTAAQEAALETEAAEQEQNLRDAISGVLADERGDIYLGTIRQIVIEELNKLRPKAGEPEWADECEDDKKGALVLIGSLALACYHDMQGRLSDDQHKRTFGVLAQIINLARAGLGHP